MRKVIPAVMVVFLAIGVAGCETMHVHRTEVGTLAGGVAGGVIGHSLGAGNAAATIGGTLGGAYIGNRLSKQY